MTNKASKYRYTQKLRHILLGAGLEGISQFHLNQKSRTRIFSVSDMMEVLEEWESREWVQKFKTQLFAKRPTTIWRATTKLRDEWSTIHFDRPLPTEPVAEEIIPERMF
jgi:hypothetical protein